MVLFFLQGIGQFYGALILTMPVAIIFCSTTKLVLMLAGNFHCCRLR